MDYNFPYNELTYMFSTTSKAMVEKMKNIFARSGVLEWIASDNGPQFTGSAAFEEFAESYKIELTPSSLGLAQSKGQAESSVQIAKKSFTIWIHL